MLGEKDKLTNSKVMKGGQKTIKKLVAPAFEDYLFNWDYEQYLLIGGYGSGKSYQTALKLILKLLSERRKVIVLRQVYDTIRDSCYDLLCEILEDMGILTDSPYVYKRSMNKVIALKNPMRINFHNGSKIVFRGLDKPEKIKSINNISIIWVEECSEINYAAYKELLGRIRTAKASMHFLLTCNPVGKENWVYQHFFRKMDDRGRETVIQEEEEFYNRKVLVNNGTYYHHSLPTDNPWCPPAYLKRLDKLQEYDPYLYMVARWGRFGATGTRVLPQLEVAQNPAQFRFDVNKLGPENMYFGFDFGFEESYNAVLSMSVDLRKSILYIWDEIYINKVTDNVMAELPEMQRLKERINWYNEMGYQRVISADNEDPKAIAYYRQCGYPIRKCRNKFKGSRLSNTRKVKRFAKIIVSPKCQNTIRELRDLTYLKDTKGNVIYDEFNIDPHTFSAIWYGLDTVTVADLKDKEFYSKKGG